MTLLDRLTNPLWHKASKLDPSRQVIVALVTSAIGWFRQSIQQELVYPLETSLKGSSLRAAPLSGDEKAHLVDEALVALFRCCKSPSIDPAGKVPAAVLQGLPELLGILILGQAHDGAKGSLPETLDQTHYSRDPAEARTQLLVRWMEILRIASPLFVTIATARGFDGAWGGLVDHSISGMLRGFGRVPNEVVIARGRSAAASLSTRQARIIEHFIDTLAQPSFDRAGRARRLEG